jgi:hypothetical protein
MSNQVKGEWKLKTREDIDAANTKFTNILKEAAHLATPATKIHAGTMYLPSKIKCLVALNRKARATWQKTHAPENRRIFNNGTNKLKTALHTLRNENFTTFVSSLSNSDHSIWKRIKSRRKPCLQAPPIRKNSTPPGPWAKSDDDKTKLFASHLAEVYTPTLTPRPRSRKHARQPHKMLRQNSTTQSLRLKPSYQKTIPNQGPRPGPYYSPNDPGATPSGQKTLLQLYNTMLRLEYWPTVFKLARVIMILKPGKQPAEVTSYRPISLLSTVSNILEKFYYTDY